MYGLVGSFMFPLHLNIHVMGVQPLEIIQCEDRHYTSESDVHRRQILTYNHGPRAERVKPHGDNYNVVFQIYNPDSAQCLFSLSDDDTQCARLPVTSLNFQPSTDTDKIEHKHIIMATCKLKHIIMATCRLKHIIMATCKLKHIIMATCKLKHIIMVTCKLKHIIMATCKLKHIIMATCKFTLALMVLIEACILFKDVSKQIRFPWIWHK